MATAISPVGTSLLARSAPFSSPTISLRSTSSNFAPVVRQSALNTKLVSSRRAVGVRAAGIDIANIVPQADRILLRLDTPSEQSSGGVLLPRSAVKFERYLIGEVLAIGAEVEKIEKGSKVLVSDVNAYEVNLGTQDKLCFARAGDLLAVVE